MFMFEWQNLKWQKISITKCDFLQFVMAIEKLQDITEEDERKIKFFKKCQKCIFLMPNLIQIAECFSYPMTKSFHTSKYEYFLPFQARTYLQPHYGNGVLGNVYLSAGQH